MSLLRYRLLHPHALMGVVALTFPFLLRCSKIEAKGVFVIDGAITFTRVFGASSAASDLLRPSRAPLDAATLA